MDKIYLGNKLENFESSEPFLPISRVILKVDGQNGYIAGDESGRTIEKTMPWATQAMADSILASLKGQVYKPYSGSGALLDPAAELGDALTVAGEYGVLAGMSRQLDRMGISDISAPGADELEDEFPYTSKSQREVERVLGKAYSRISKTADKIMLEVADEVKEINASISLTANGIRTEVKNIKDGLESSISQTSKSIRSELKSTKDGLESTINQTATSIRAEIKSTKDGLESSLSQTAWEIRAELSNTKTGLETTISTTASGLSASIRSVDGRVTTLNATVSGISSRVSDAEGNISSLSQTATSLQSQIKTTNGNLSTVTQTANKINWLVKSGTSASDFQMTDRAISLVANKIDLTGYVTFSSLTEAGKTSINGANITTGKISANRLNLTGEITWNDLSESVQNDINDAYSMAEDAADTVGGWQYKGTTYIDGTMLKTGTVTASTLEGGEIYLLDAAGDPAGVFELSGADSYSGQKMQIYSGATSILALYGSVYLGGADGAFLDIDSFVSVGGDLAPSVSEENSCGRSSRKWTDIYAVNSEIQTSDRAKKKDIFYDLSFYEEFFNALTPCAFRFRNAHERVHLGLIAQDVEEQMEKHGIDSMELAAFIKSPNESGDGYDYGLRYGEFISLLIDQVQKLKKRVKTLEEAS